GDLLAGHVGELYRAGPRRNAVDVDRAGAALRDAATIFGAGHAERIAQHPQQRGVGLDVDVMALTIDDEGWHSVSPVSSPVMRRKRWRASGYLGRGRKRVRASGASIACFQADENSSSGNIRSGQQVAVARSCSASAPESAARIAKSSNAIERSAAVGMGIIEIPVGREFRRELFGFRAESAIPGVVQAAFLMSCGKFPAPSWAGNFHKSAGNLSQAAGNCLRSRPEVPRGGSKWVKVAKY